jgi:hypothetical protein
MQFTNPQQTIQELQGQATPRQFGFGMQLLVHCSNSIICHFAYFGPLTQPSSRELRIDRLAFH